MTRAQCFAMIVLTALIIAAPVIDTFTHAHTALEGVR